MSRTSLIEKPQKAVDPRPFFDVFKLDKMFKSATQQTPVFQRDEKPKSFCLVCCLGY
jgi:hypothetical protein